VPCFWKTFVQTVGEFREIVQRHGAVLDEGDRLSVALHRHHDIEPALRTAVMSACDSRREPYDRIGMAVIGEYCFEAFQ